MSDDQPLDIFALLDEVQAIARTGLHYSENPFDRERYTRLLAAAQRQYTARTTLEASAVRERFEAEIGYVTAKVGADAAVFDDHDRILLARRADDDKWGLIAGWVDPNESPEQTAVRELAEEVGVQARVDRLVGVFFREARGRAPARHGVDRLPGVDHGRTAHTAAPRGPRARVAGDRRRGRRRMAPPSRDARARRARGPLAVARGL